MAAPLPPQSIYRPALERLRDGAWYPTASHPASAALLTVILRDRYVETRGNGAEVRITAAGLAALGGAA